MRGCTDDHEVTGAQMAVWRLLMNRGAETLVHSHGQRPLDAYTCTHSHGFFSTQGCFRLRCVLRPLPANCEDQQPLIRDSHALAFSGDSAAAGSPHR